VCVRARPSSGFPSVTKQMVRVAAVPRKGERDVSFVRSSSSPRLAGPAIHSFVQPLFPGT
jgi:hypothetical protein